MEFIDTHTHLYDEAYGGPEGSDRAVKAALEAGVTRLVIPDVNSRERKDVLALCRRWPGKTFACMGLHPTEVGEDWKEELETLERDLTAAHQAMAAGEFGTRLVAIGETGLDYHYGADTKEAQKEVFRTQVNLALQYDLPLVIHSREATADTLGILGEFRGRGLRGVFHAYSGSLETFRELDRYGNWSIGIGGVLTFKKASIAEFVREIPLERILLETDSPYLTPTPHRGERNESAYIPIIASKLAELKGCSLEQVADVTSSNAEKLFNL